MKSPRFEGKVAIVTGAGRGLGRAYALELAQRGAKVVVNDAGLAMDGTGESAAPARQVADEIVSAGGIAVANTGSVDDLSQARALVEQALDAFGALHIVINNAGILRDRSFAKKDLADFRKVLDVHLWGTVQVTHAAWPILMNQQYGRVLLTSSGSGILGNFGQSDYGTAKTAMLGLMNCLALEGERKNVRVNTIKPAAATRMAQGVVSDAIFAKLKPELIVPAALCLVADDAPNGWIVQATGGHFSRVVFAQNEGVDLGAGASCDALAGRWERIEDISALMPVKHQETA
ncbi:MAG TPA: SDR family NAD(P)-dependent oxidoreductase [Rhizomicrobium sp.]